MSTRIYKDNDEIRFEVTDDIYVYTHKYSKKVVTIQDVVEDSDVDIWTEDIDALIDALLDLKREIKNATGE